VLLAGCVPRPVALPPPEFGAAEVARLLAQPLNQVQTLQASGTMHVRDGAVRHIVEILLVVQTDRALRLDALTPFGTPLFTFIAAPDHVRLLDHLERCAWRGPADAPTVERLLHFGVEPGLLPQVAVGGVRRDAPPWSAEEPAAEEDPDYWYFRSGDWRVVIDPEERRAVRLSAEGDDSWTLGWLDVRPVAGLPVPHRLEIERPARRQSLHLKLNDIRVNQPVDGALWQPEIPIGWREERILATHGTGG
jgi:hypothetical protein